MGDNDPNQERMKRFEKSRSRLHTPVWMTKNKSPSPRPSSPESTHNLLTGGASKGASAVDDGQYQCSTPEMDTNNRLRLRSLRINSGANNTSSLLGTGRPRYSEFRAASAASVGASRSSSAASGRTRGRAPAAGHYWRTAGDQSGQEGHTTPTPSGSQPHQQRDYSFGGAAKAPMSREPSPAPSWTATATTPSASTSLAAKLLQGGVSSALSSNATTTNCNNTFSRYSASTLCDSAYSGNNTPTTESVASGVSNKSLLQSGYHYQRYQSRPYLGWRSHDNLIDPNKYHYSTPADRLALSLRKGTLSGGNSSGSIQQGNNYCYYQGGTGSSGFQMTMMMPGQNPRCRSADPRHYSVYSRDGRPGPSRSHFSGHHRLHQQSLGGQSYGGLHNSSSHSQQQLIRDSIHSVSSAIMEFCNADDVPLKLPDDHHVRRQRHRSKERRPRSKIVWLESSFVCLDQPKKVTLRAD